ncbi:putative trafficking protein particle complex subunit [Clavispora lusitaniae]|uniref:Trafficking protein particle complex subunit n=1 Tax=Clavispora lusitaniae TaxID=36911 RepID=A0ACD0WMP3_CLALS|nr:hypothetical protein E0198_003198 [Clavispora lusitaniae]QFZ28327.1 putative trafficking protein particle complex subunit [Clavispora lusitaniae]QFZ33990.1 putative trafficking protein particle complex subunit [Clavispora lusitaniae]QFZ39674.1 putative trafficking protein particle complex subunit [Clavispora lusitaniae]QFZ45356.1 putative trafficking protein particle complex subunit [Clavispora lusitaniae]
MQFKSLLAIAAASGLAVAANNSSLTTATPSVNKACSFSDFTATTATQVSQIAACATAVGDITISGEGIGSVELNGVQAVYGSLLVNGTKATVLDAPTLQLVAGDLTVSDSTILSTVNFAQLTTVGSLTFNALPALEKTGLTTGLTSAEEITIQNTGLTSLDGINVFELKTFDVNNNADIESIDSGLQSVTDFLSINYNADKVEVVLDKLTSANNVEFQHISSLSVANLTTVNGSLSLQSNTFESIEFPQLKSIGKSLSINKNDELEEFDFPKLTTVGGALNVQDNQKLDSFSGFPKVKQISGSVNLAGDFNNGTFPDLERVAGGFNLTSTGDLTCDSFVKLNKDGDIKGDKFYCEGASSTISSSSSKSGNANGSSTESSDSDSSSGSNSSSSASSSSSSSSSKKSGAAPVAGVQLASFAVAFAGIGAFLY